jgi:hypothetical protein
MKWVYISRIYDQTYGPYPSSRSTSNHLFLITSFALSRVSDVTTCERRETNIQRHFVIELVDTFLFIVRPYFRSICLLQRTSGRMFPSAIARASLLANGRRSDR